MARGDVVGLDALALRGEVERALGAMEDVRRIKVQLTNASSRDRRGAAGAGRHGRARARASRRDRRAVAAADAAAEDAASDGGDRRVRVQTFGRVRLEQTCLVRECSERRGHRERGGGAIGVDSHARPGSVRDLSTPQSGSMLGARALGTAAPAAQRTHLAQSSRRHGLVELSHDARAHGGLTERVLAATAAASFGDPALGARASRSRVTTALSARYLIAVAARADRRGRAAGAPRARGDADDRHRDRVRDAWIAPRSPTSSPPP